MNGAPVDGLFESESHRARTSLLGMWLFLATEVLFFGGMFLAYAVYRWKFPQVFVEGSQMLDVKAGTFNTFVLLSSSLTIALVEPALDRSRLLRARALLLATLVFGVMFLGIKGFEYREEWREGLIPFVNETFAWNGAHPQRGKLFFNLYFVMTGLHAVHLLIGCVLVTLLLARRARHNLMRQLRVTALYWHFVDIVWVFLFPLLYLAR